MVLHSISSSWRSHEREVAFLPGIFFTINTNKACVMSCTCLKLCLALEIQQVCFFFSEFLLFLFRIVPIWNHHERLCPTLPTTTEQNKSDCEIFDVKLRHTQSFRVAEEKWDDDVNVVCAGGDLLFFFWFCLFSKAAVRARAHIYPRHIALRSGLVLYIFLRSTIMAPCGRGAAGL